MSFPADYRERDLNPPDAGAPTQEVCRYCERPFYEADSDADDRTRFCSRDCQEDAADDGSRDPRERDDDDGQTYADPGDELIERLLR